MGDRLIEERAMATGMPLTFMSSMVGQVSANLVFGLMT